MTFRLGVTGGIGSGKTTVCRVFSVLGVRSFKADEEAKVLMNNNLNVREQLNSIAGKDIYPNGVLDRQELARLIFNNVTLLNSVNQIVHPFVLAEFERWASKSEDPYVIMEAAILFESNAYMLVDKIVSISAPIEERIARVMGRSDLTRNQVIERVNSQLEDEERNQRSDYVINNSDSELIIPEILKIHDDMIRLAAKKK